MGKKKLNIIVILSLIIIGILSYLFLFRNRTIQVESILLDKNSITLVVGTNEKINATVLPENATDKTLVWESMDPSIATITSDGILFANKIGNTRIVVKTLDGTIESNCLVTVERKKIENIIISKASVDLIVGEKENLSITIIPEELRNNAITWSSSNPTVAKVDENGEIRAISEGEAIITAASIEDKKEGTCLVKVSSIPVSSVTLNYTNRIIAKGASDLLTALVSPSNATYQDILWESDNPNIVEIDSEGRIKAKTSGEVTITATTKNNIKATCKIKVLSVKTFNQQNEAITEYLNNPSASTVKSVYKKYKCSSGGANCDRPKNYTPEITGDINIYRYYESNNSKTLIVKNITSKDVRHYLVPNSIYYLESAINHNDIEIVKITGNLRMIDEIGNFRDLGGWQADGGTVKYGKLFRSRHPDGLDTLNVINALNIQKVVDLRRKSEIIDNTLVKSMRKIISIDDYQLDDKTREAVTEIIKTVGEKNKNVLFHCVIGRDRTGTVAYILEGLLGVSTYDRGTDYELSYFAGLSLTRAGVDSLDKKIKSYKMTNYEQERFINWYLSTSTNKEADLKLINNFRKIMIDGTPHQYKLVNNKLTLA